VWSGSCCPVQVLSSAKKLILFSHLCSVGNRLFPHYRNLLTDQASNAPDMDAHRSSNHRGRLFFDAPKRDVGEIL
ncbi:MAG: hypothetical protein ACO22O_15895, partial [bacterium]